MSAYVNLFIRNKDKFIPLGSYNKNSGIYSIISTDMSIPWEKITSITYDTLVTWGLSAEYTIKNLEKEINRIKEMFKLIDTCTLEDAFDYSGIINNYKEDIEEIKGIKYIFTFMKNILDEYEYDDEYNVDEILYMGMEIGEPTIDDIV